jgi:hypothetical protein
VSKRHWMKFVGLAYLRLTWRYWLDGVLPGDDVTLEAHEESAKLAKPFLDTMESTTATYERERVKLAAKLGAPAGEFSEIQIAEARSKLSGMQATARFTAIKRSIDKGSDLLVAVMTKSDPFLVGDLLSESEQAVMIDHWRKSRFPQEFLRSQVIESDIIKISNTARLLENYQRTMSNPSIAAGALAPSPIQYGKPGPQPRDRGRALSLEDRANITAAAILAQQKRAG